MLGAFLRYRYQKDILRQRPDNELIRLFEASGGALYSRISFDADAVGKARKRGLRLTRNPVTLTMEAGKNIVSTMHDLIAISDAPPRLAEMLSAAERSGYRLNARGKFVDTRTGKVVDHLPEHVTVRMTMAAAEATINFRRSGTRSRFWDLVFPFLNANIQAQYRQYRQIKNVKKTLGKKSDDRDEGRRTLVYWSALAAAGVAYALQRAGDDDWEEQENWMRDQFWSYGEGGRTLYRLPKPRDAAVISNFAEHLTRAVVAEASDDELAEAVLAIRRDVKGRVPMGGGPFRAIGEIAANYDAFRQMSIEPSYMQDTPVAFRATAYTKEASKWFSENFSHHLGLSPLQTEHLFNGMSGGAYNRWAEAIENRFADPKYIPGARAVLVDRYQNSSINEFYDLEYRTSLAAKEAEITGEEDQSLAADDAKLKQYKELMGKIRSVEPRKLRGQRSWKHQPYLVALARQAMGKDPLESAPDPFHDPVPDAVANEIRTFAFRKAKVAIALYDEPGVKTEPKRSEYQTDWEFDEAKAKYDQWEAEYPDMVEKWERDINAGIEWLREHQGSPLVQDAIDRAKRLPKLRGLRKVAPPEWKGDPRKFVKDRKEWLEARQRLRRAATILE